MLLLNKNGLKIGFDAQEASSVGVKLHYVESPVKAFSLVAMISGLSNGEVRRKIQQGGVWLGDEKCTDPNEIIESGNVAMTVFLGKELQGVVVPLRS